MEHSRTYFFPFYFLALRYSPHSATYSLYNFWKW